MKDLGEDLTLEIAVCRSHVQLNFTFTHLCSKIIRTSFAIIKLQTEFDLGTQMSIIQTQWRAGKIKLPLH